MANIDKRSKKDELFAMIVVFTSNPGLAYKKAFSPTSTKSPNEFTLQAYDYMENNPKLKRSLDRIKNSYRRVACKDRGDLLADIQYIYALALEKGKLETALAAIREYSKLSGLIEPDPLKTAPKAIEINIIQNTETQKYIPDIGKKPKKILITDSQQAKKAQVPQFPELKDSDTLQADPYLLGKIDN